MIKIENVVTPSAEQWEAIIRGTRNPMNSWGKSDTSWRANDPTIGDKELLYSDKDVLTSGAYYNYVLGENDKSLMMKLRNAGTDHRKFMRMITVYVDITAPLYWWKEFDTYKVGTVTNSCSTMHKIHEKEFTLEDFSCEHLLNDWQNLGDTIEMNYGDYSNTSLIFMEEIVGVLNKFRELYLHTKDKKYWWQMIQLLPSSYNQKRTVMLNYEVLANIYKSRRNHKLDEWVEFCKWIETLPYSELITGNSREE